MLYNAINNSHADHFYSLFILAKTVINLLTDFVDQVLFPCIESGDKQQEMSFYCSALCYGGGQIAMYENQYVQESVGFEST